jgi:hypothetical protein
MPTHNPFRFAFEATSDKPEAIPYVARLRWNSQLKRVEQQLYPMNRQALSATTTRVFGEFPASPMEIIETRRGALTRKRKTVELISWFLVVPRGYLVLIGEGQDTTASDRITRYLSGTLSVNDLGNQRWDFQSAVSDWKALPEHPPTIAPMPPRLQYLEQRRDALQHELQEIERELAALKGSAAHA